MNHLRKSLITLAVAAAVPASAAAAPSDHFEGWSAGIGPELMRLERSADVNGPSLAGSIDAKGIQYGIQAHIRKGDLFVGELRLSKGELNFDSTGGNVNQDNNGAEIRATFGGSIGTNDRLYGGIGHTTEEVELGDTGYDWKTSSTYVPVGYALSVPMGGNWMLNGRFEGRLLIAGDEKFTGLPNAGSITMSHGTGLGAEASVEFANTANGIGIEPYITMMRPGDVDDASGFEIDSISNTAIGVRGNFPF